MTLEEWIDKNASKLSEDIKIHINMVTDVTCEVEETLHRLIMISIRDTYQQTDDDKCPNCGYWETQEHASYCGVCGLTLITEASQH